MVIDRLALNYIDSLNNKTVTVLNYSLYADQLNTWKDEAYRTIILDEPATGDLLTCLKKNAVKQEK